MMSSFCASSINESILAETSDGLINNIRQVECANITF